MRLASALLLLAACEPTGPVPVGDYSASCKHDLPGEPILDATGSFEVLDTTPVIGPLAVGTHVGGTGSLTVVGCIPSAEAEILDRLVFEIELVLFDIDDQAIDLPVADDATGVNVLWGTVTDWDDVVDWDNDETFTHFKNGSSSFSELDKQGRLVGTVDVTQTDPAGTPMRIDIDLTW